MIQKFVAIALLGVFLSPTLLAADGVSFELTVRQVGAERSAIVYADTVQLVEGLPAIGFAGPLSLDVEITELDSVAVRFNLHVVTLGANASTYGRSFVVEYTLPARIDEITGKNGSRYACTLIPLERVEIDTVSCEYNHRERGVFDASPSAYMDFHYVPTSLGDFYWLSAKELLERYNRHFQVFAHFDLPGKTAIYLAPCRLHSVIWDDRFGMMVDPTRNIAFALFNKELNTVDPFLITQAAILRNLGYAPLLLSEGLANYFSFSVYDMKGIFKAGNALPLGSLLDPHTYFSSDPRLTDRSGASFVKYLIDQYSLERFLRLYREADDLNLAALLETTYGKSVGELEREWQGYVDSVAIPASVYATHASDAEQMMRYSQMKEYARGWLGMAQSRIDSVRAVDMLKRACFFEGDYYGAAEWQHTLLSLDSSDAIGWMSLGSYQMMGGYNEEGLVNLRKAQSLDTASQIIPFNLAVYYINQGLTDSARAVLSGNLTDGARARAQGETRVLLGLLLADSDTESDHSRADELLSEAITQYSQVLQANRSSASVYMWMGIAYFGLADYSNALNYLHTAEFLETRAFYQGMIYLWLGKTYDAMGDKSLSRDYFGRVLNMPSADYQQKEARAYLEQS